MQALGSYGLRMDPLPVTVASPCTQKWSEMKGDARTRFCERCALTVYNLPEYTAEEVRALIKEREGRVCVRLVRRFDGTLMTRDCKGGVRQEFEKRLVARTGSTRIDWKTWAGITASVVAFLFALAVIFGDNIKAYFGGGMVGALAGDPVVTRRLPNRNLRPTRPPQHISSWDHDSTY